LYWQPQAPKTDSIVPASGADIKYKNRVRLFGRAIGFLCNHRPTIHFHGDNAIFVPDPATSMERLPLKDLIEFHPCRAIWFAGSPAPNGDSFCPPA
jgi:hypothetical protein